MNTLKNFALLVAAIVIYNMSFALLHKNNEIAAYKLYYQAAENVIDTINARHSLLDKDFEGDNVWIYDYETACNNVASYNND